MKPVLIGAAVVVIAGAIAFFVLRPKEAPPAPPPPPQVAAPAPRAPDAPLPPAGTSDEQVRKALAPVSASPKLAEWLRQDDLLDRWVVIADNIAEDVSPRKQMPFAAPSKDFRKLDEKGYARYDFFADVIGSIDAKAVAAAVRALHPLLESAYHKLGYPDRDYDDTEKKALQRLVDAPVVEGPIALASKGAVWQFADPKLERLGPVEKHLLRMGPRNEKIIQSKARELLAAHLPQHD